MNGICNCAPAMAALNSGAVTLVFVSVLSVKKFGRVVASKTFHPRLMKYSLSSELL